MKLNHAGADILVPDGMDVAAALKRTTHLGVGAHQDDLEIMAFHGILQCFGRSDQWFTGVTCTDGAGSPRAGVYAGYSDEDMQRVRREEQRTAARIGRYGAMLQLDYSSKEMKDPANPRPAGDLAAILDAARPRAVYTHNLLDKHPTHVAVTLAVIRALRTLPPDARPEHVYGCEVWRDLDWLPDARKIVLDVSDRQSLAAALAGVHDSQVAGGKRYDLATVGRWRANATYLASHAVDVAQFVTFALELRPLIEDAGRDPLRFAGELIDEFRHQACGQIESLGPAVPHPA